MRIERLEIEGFGPFAGPQRIDFGPLDDAGVFLITGRTGSGKSSILDAICFALYGTAPRYDNAQSRLRSDHAGPDTPTRVVLQFAAGGRRWRVSRSPEYERPKRRGTGSTKEPQAASLERWDGEQWTGVAARAVDVAEHLAPVLQLTREQFLQVILLAQGRFQEFLKAKSDERIGLLRALFGTERFARFEAEVGERAKVLEQSVGLRAGALRTDLARLAELVDEPAATEHDPDWATATASRLAAVAAGAEDEVADADAAFEAADRVAARAAADAELQRRRRAAEAALQRLAEQRPVVESDRARVAEAVRALPVIPALDAADRAATALGESVRTAEGAAAALGDTVADPTGAAQALDAVLGSLDGPLADETRLPRLHALVDEAEHGRAEAEQRRARITAESAELPALRDDLLQRRAAAGAVAARSETAAAELATARRTSAAALQARTLVSAAEAAEAAYGTALGAEEHAVARTRALLQARLAGAAELLAARLTDAEPCPVCGSREHPAPASGDGGIPDEAAVARAEAGQQAAADRRAAARTAAVDARAAATAAVAASGGATAEAAAAAQRAAEQAAADARVAVAERDRLDAELAGVAQRAGELDRAAQTAEGAALVHAQAVATAAADRDAAAERVTAARGDSPTVRVRVAGLTRRRALLRSLAEAERASRSAEAEHRRAVDRLQEALQEAALPDAAAARRAALPGADRQQRERRVRAWDDAWASATAQLVEPEVAAAPEEPADVTGTTAAKATAQAARVAAGDRLAEHRSRAARAAELAAAVRAVDAGIAADRAQLEVLAPLAEVVRGGGANEKRMRLEGYVLAARLEQIVAAANVRLGVMTDGRFTLQHDDSVAYRNARSGLGLEVLDEHTGRPRPVASLSGGETFLASLALALGLAEVVSAEAGGVHLDTLFVDEGFGSLDRQTLDTAMETLDSLRAGGRVVGLISHVEAMQEDIPAGLHVERAPDGSSTVSLRAGVRA